MCNIFLHAKFVFIARMFVFLLFLIKMIVLSGETGAGKTFNAWKVLSFLTGSPMSKCDAQRRDETCGILQKIMLACTLISDFTTASTEKNNNSSRHVQLLWLEYKMGNICGATISSYLLETNRVTKNSCNFHIFNQVKLINH